MDLDKATRKRILELVEENNNSLTNLCLNSNLTPSTVFDFMNGKSKSPTSKTIKKLCMGANITLKDFYDRDYFNDFSDIC